MSHDREYFPSCSVGDESMSVASYASAGNRLRQRQQNEKLCSTLGFIKAHPIADDSTERLFDSYPHFLQCLCDCLRPELYHFTCKFAPEALRSFLVLNLCEARNALIARSVSFTEHYNTMLFFHFALLSEKPLQEVFISAWKLLNKLTSRSETHSDQKERNARTQCFVRMFEGVTLLIHSCVFFFLNKAYSEKGLSFLTCQTLDPENWVTHFAEANCDEALKLVRVACAHLFKTLTGDRQFAIHCAENLIALYVNISLSQRYLKELQIESTSIDKVLSLLQEVRRWCSRALDCIFENVSFEQKCQKMISATLLMTSPWIDFVNQQSITHSELSKVVTEIVDDVIACLVFHLSDDEVTENLRSSSVRSDKADDENQSLFLRLGLTPKHFSGLFDYILRYTQAVLLSTNAPNESKLEFTCFTYIASIYLHFSGMNWLSLHVVEKYLLPTMSYRDSAPSDTGRLIEMATCSIIAHSGFCSHPRTHKSMQTYLQLLCLLGRHQSPFFELMNTDISIPKDTMCNLSLPKESLNGLLLNFGRSCPLHLWKSVFSDDALSNEKFIQLAEAFFENFSLDTQVVQKAIRIELEKNPSYTPSAFWKTNEAFENATERISETVDQSELNGVVQIVAHSIVSRGSQNSFFMLHLPVQHTFEICSRIESLMENAQSESGFEHTALIQIFKKSSRIVGTHDFETDAPPERFVSDMAQLKQHLERICTLCKQQEKALGDSVIHEMNVVLSTTLLCFV